eukprot:CAMPEP_0182903940 /NCGR_PEP_ID=MMETSP0034_2-20130328/31733_1 /TAXON_ID=156128 /ORGANISM="Nephroselmis pyriformis, Strain CCMP717" /LENGTH=32 /DNA_ID= /DNA_START= /DNA_END= /DNA_ORIENTATION=
MALGDDLARAEEMEAFGGEAMEEMEAFGGEAM